MPTFRLSLAALISAAVVLTFPSAGGAATVDVYTLEGIINPSATEYLVNGIAESNRRGAELVVIVLDTPGGLDPSMRAITKEILNSPRPVAVFVSPRGARAASAGTFITMAAHLAGMAPGTSIGAAHPVLVGGKPGKDMRQKMENDAASYIRSIAESRGRNADWAEKAVRQSVSATETEARSLNVIDLVAPDLASFIESADGRTVTAGTKTITLATKGATVNRIGMDLRRRILQTISDPTIAYLLMTLGGLGLFFELAHPGAVLPGVVGAISLLLGLWGMQTLPINYTGFLLIVLAVILFVAEVKITSYGFLTIGGIISLVLGSLMLVDSPAPFLRISWPAIAAAAATAVLLFVILAGAVVRVHRKQPTTGKEGLLGAVAEARTDLNPRGRVFVHSELWEARCAEGAAKGERVRITGMEGLVLIVEPLTAKEA